jgi:methyl-accepting chemotaxis protein
VAIAVVMAVVVGVLGLQSLSASAKRTAAMYTQNTLGAQPAEELPRMASDLRTTVSRFTY